MVVYNAERNLYRVVIGTFDDRASAENLRDSFKAKHPPGSSSISLSLSLFPPSGDVGI